MITNSNLLRVASFSPDVLPGHSAWIGHIPFAAWLMREIQPKLFVELGTYFGHSYFSFCEAAKELDISLQCYAVDTWKGDEHSGFYEDNVFNFVHNYNSKHYAKFSYLLRTQFDEAASNFADNSIELLHIDGLHTYEAVCHDFETWLPKLAPGAIVLLHDTNVREKNFGVWKLWKELQEVYSSTMEFLHSSGLGVLQLNNASSEENMGWMKRESNETNAFISYFSALGLHQQRKYEINSLKLHQADFHAVEARLHATEAKLLGMEVKLHETEANLTAIRRSTSWKITLMFRELKKWLVSPKQQSKIYVTKLRNFLNEKLN